MILYLYVYEGIDRESLFSLPNEKLHNAQDEEGLTTGVTLYDHMAQESTKAKTKPASKAAVPRSSTLMKPTASHLAKQNQPREVGGNRFLQRSWKSRVKHNEKISETGIESQAAKRQKLEAGCLRKVSEIKQQVNLMHKVSKKVTIPREPELKTAHRAQRIRPKSNIVSGESVKPMGHTFKARPLNKKILEAPSLLRPQKSTPRLPEFQEFHLKTSERAAASSLPKNKSVKVVYKPSTCSIMHNDTVNSNRPMGFTDKENELKPKFKARPFNKKIFSSKGDIGVFRNTKKEPTVPMEFKFSTANRLQHHPPIELFSKLSLASELQQNTVPQQKFPQNTSIPTKGLKENIVGPSQTEHGVSHTSKEKLQQLVGKQQIQCGTGGRISETGHRANTSRSLSIR
uniref:TPX2 central domain-containing protein n=1 Tax=Nelumbo nucifera TaxID=4432 RepID=A0A822YHV6_NELNU|nr:TPA_asm: hypothetical protein HUJ06_012625 [Nelumbo nucifera]